jgi:hypothetical protein
MIESDAVKGVLEGGYTLDFVGFHHGDEDVAHDDYGWRITDGGLEGGG